MICLGNTMKYIIILLLCILLVISERYNVIRCRDHRFKCKNNQCIDNEFLCDGKADCIDKSDETFDICSSIACPKFTFTCKYGACIHLKSHCNGVQNCLDNSDELNCLTSVQEYIAINSTASLHLTLNKKKNTIKGKYVCQSGEIIDEEFLCDGQQHCLDYSDETSELCSKIFCPYFTFRCQYGACIRLSEKCNGVNNCIDGSDERFCTTSTLSPVIQTPDISKPIKKLFRCHSGILINEELLCDGQPNCDDGSDETSEECSGFHCPNFTYKCKYGACVLAGAKCNGVKECADNSDESTCTQTALQSGVTDVIKFKCNSGQTINADLVCDGKADCRDFSDESSRTCSHINCPHFAYKCNYGGCVHGTARCNGLKECFDNSDEAFCPMQKMNTTKLKEPFKDYLIFS